jgi:hypothetical protein
MGVAHNDTSLADERSPSSYLPPGARLARCSSPCLGVPDRFVAWTVPVASVSRVRPEGEFVVEGKLLLGKLEGLPLGANAPRDLDFCRLLHMRSLAMRRADEQTCNHIRHTQSEWQLHLAGPWRGLRCSTPTQRLHHSALSWILRGPPTLEIHATIVRPLCLRQNTTTDAMYGSTAVFVHYSTDE